MEKLREGIVGRRKSAAECFHLLSPQPNKVETLQITRRKSLVIS